MSRAITGTPGTAGDGSEIWHRSVPTFTGGDRIEHTPTGFVFVADDSTEQVANVRNDRITSQSFSGSGPGGCNSGEKLAGMVRIFRLKQKGARGLPSISTAATLMNLALSPRTCEARAASMAAVCTFMRESGVNFPLVYGDQIALVGFFYECLVKGVSPGLSYASLGGYLSGIRMTHEALGLGRFPTAGQNNCFKAVGAGYARDEGGIIQPAGMRIALPPDVLYKILPKGRRDNAQLSDVRGSALIICASIYGLRPSSVQSIKENHVEVRDSDLKVLVRALKGRSVQAAMGRGGKLSIFHKPRTRVTLSPLRT